MDIWSISGTSAVLIAVAVLLSYVFSLAVSRLYLSPISKFPGPKLAALTLWYEFYYDVVLHGQYAFHIRGLHEKYGPIIRINPYELHVSDSNYYETLYASSASGEKRDKWEWYTKMFGTPSSGFSTVGHNQHRARRAPLNSFFSMASVRRLQPVVEERVEALIGRLRGFKNVKGEEGVLKLEYALSAFTNDVVMEYCFGRSEHRLEQADFSPSFHDANAAVGVNAALFRQMFWIYRVMSSFPDWLTAMLSPSIGSVLRSQHEMMAQIRQIKSKPQSTFKDLPHPVIFSEILASSLPESEKTSAHLRDEANVMVGAGTMTTAWALSVATYHLLANPTILSTLKSELHTALPSSSSLPPLPELEKLPYLTAVIQEALRLSYGVSTRLARVSPSLPLLFTDSHSGKTWSIPPGTPVSMTSVLVHQDESIFPNAQVFDPERWLNNPRLVRYLVSFTKGSRQCLGMNLAYAEQYLCLAAIWRRFGSQEVRYEDDVGVLELFETGQRDVELAAAAFIPGQAEGSKGLVLSFQVNIYYVTRNRALLSNAFSHTAATTIKTFEEMSNSNTPGLQIEDSDLRVISESAPNRPLAIWEDTQQVRDEIVRADQAKEIALKDHHPLNDNVYYGPRIFDATAHEVYNDKELLDEELKLAELMFRLQDMRETLNTYYERFLDLHPGFDKHNRNSRTSVPMCTVMQDDESLTWGSSARTNKRGMADRETKTERKVEEMTRALNMRCGIRKYHLRKWKCGEQGCLNRIAREKVKSRMMAGDGKPSTEDLAADFHESKFKSLSLKSRGRFNEPGKWVVRNGLEDFFPACGEDSAPKYGCKHVFSKTNTVDLAREANRLLQRQEEKLAFYNAGPRPRVFLPDYKIEWRRR
ncbi:hypothetical protein MMC11_001838 [Xylographa trunciseda]|nr:hypothetical protein [Xylographa trunciseda]